MALPGFSKFEQMFRAKLAVNAPVEVLKAKKQKEGLTEEEVGWAGGWKVGGVWRGGGAHTLLAGWKQLVDLGLGAINALIGSLTSYKD